MGDEAMKLSMILSGVVCVTLLSFGVCACDRAEDRPGRTTTRSGELRGAARGLSEAALPTEPSRRATEGEGLAVDGGARTATRDAGVRTEDSVARDPRFDAGRLSFVGSAEERDRNLGLSRDGGGASATEVAVPAPQQGAGLVENPPAPRKRDGAGRPGAAGDPYQ